MSQKKLSLQEQLLKSGLVTTAQARSANAEKRKQSQLQRNNNVQITDEARELAQKAQAEKLERDRELNKLKQQQDAQKQIAAQIRQLIEQNRIKIDDDAVDRYDDSLAYHFTDGNKVKKLFVPKTLREQIAGGRLAIVKLEQRYEVVSAAAAEKIKSRDPASVIVLNAPGENQTENSDDPYADYQIPDDLIW